MHGISKGERGKEGGRGTGRLIESEGWMRHTQR